jgi:hypothetical protein
MIHPVRRSVNTERRTAGATDDLFKNQPVQMAYWLEMSRWVGWTVNLALVRWWQYRTVDRPAEIRLPQDGAGSFGVV